MKRQAILKLSIIIFLLVTISNSFPTDISGRISTSRTWTKAESPYFVNADIILMDGVTLTLEPGVEIQFSPKTAFIIYGELIARGTPEQKILLTCLSKIYSPGNLWRGILFKPSSPAGILDEKKNYLKGSILEYVIIENGGCADIKEVGCEALVNAHDTKPIIRQCIIQKFQSRYGIYTAGAVEHNLVQHNFNGGGIACSGDAINNTITEIFTSRAVNILDCYGDAIANKVSQITIKGNMTLKSAIIFSAGNAIENEIKNIQGSQTIGIETPNHAYGNNIENFAVRENYGCGIQAEGRCIGNRIINFKGWGVGIECDKAAILNSVHYFDVLAIKRYDVTPEFPGEDIAIRTKSYAIQNQVCNIKNNGIFAAKGSLNNRVDNVTRDGITGDLECKIFNNIVTQTGTGIQAPSYAFVKYNKLINNSIGIDFCQGECKFNSIYDNERYNFLLNSKYDVTIDSNYWKITNPDELLNKISDYYVNNEFGKVTIQPILNEEIVISNEQVVAMIPAAKKLMEDVHQLVEKYAGKTGNRESVATPALIATNSDSQKSIEAIKTSESVTTSDNPPVEFIQTESGLKYIDQVEGTGRIVQKIDRVEVNYHLWKEDGTEIGSSQKDGHSLVFIVGYGRVNKGFDEGLMGMKVGGKRKLIIPPELCLNSRLICEIPPNLMIIAEIELLSISN